jgi:hypothetical protein
MTRRLGYAFTSIHKIQPGTPIENIDAVKEFTGGGWGEEGGGH